MTTTFHDITTPLSQDPDGSIRVAGTRVTLDVVLDFYNSGHSAEQIAAEFPALPLPAVYSTIAYYLEQKGEVDAYLSRRVAEAGEIRRKIEASQPGQVGLRERLLARLGGRKQS